MAKSCDTIYCIRGCTCLLSYMPYICMGSKHPNYPQIYCNKNNSSWCHLKLPFFILRVWLRYWGKTMRALPGPYEFNNTLTTHMHLLQRPCRWLPVSKTVTWRITVQIAAPRTVVLSIENIKIYNNKETITRGAVLNRNKNSVSLWWRFLAAKKYATTSIRLLLSRVL